MPAQPAWFHRLNDIVEDLRGSRLIYLDRLAVEKLFRVGPRRARQIMAGLPGMKAGNAMAIEREALIERLIRIMAGERFRWEEARRTRLSDELARTSRQIAARRVRIEAGPDTRAQSLRDLGPSISLQPRELRIEFTGAEDLAAKLFSLSQALMNDWEAFRQALDAPTLRTST